MIVSHRSGLVLAMSLTCILAEPLQAQTRPGAPPKTAPAVLVFTRSYSPTQRPLNLEGLFPPQPKPPDGPCPPGGKKGGTTWGAVAVWIDDIVFDYGAPFDTTAMAAKVSAAMADNFSGDLTPAMNVGRASAPDSASAFYVLHMWAADQGGTTTSYACINGAWVVSNVQNPHRRWSFGWMAIGPLTWGGTSAATLRALLNKAGTALVVPTT